MPESIQPEEINFVQCNLCLHDVPVPQENSESGKSVSWVKCPVCNYHQPLRKVPGLNDLLVFGSIIGFVYIATVVAIFLSK